MDTSSGMVIGPGLDLTGSCLIYGKAIDSSGITSFFELCPDGTIIHIDSQLKIKGESGNVVCGLALALQRRKMKLSSSTSTMMAIGSMRDLKLL